MNNFLKKLNQNRNEEDTEWDGITYIDQLMFFACDAFRWDPMQIENMWDDYFFKMVILKEKQIEADNKKIKEEERKSKQKTHSGGGTRSEGVRIQRIPDENIPNDPEMDQRYLELIGSE